MPVCASVGDSESAALPEAASPLPPVHALREAEVEHLDLAVGRQLHVRRLQVAVHDAVLVGLLERFGDLASDRERLVQRQRPLRQALLQVLARDELHRQHPLAAHVLEPEECRDVRVLQRGEQLGLALEAREPLGVGGERLRQPLERDVAPEAGVGGAKHLAHPARAERRDDAVGAHLITRGQAHCALRSTLVRQRHSMRCRARPPTWRGRRRGRILPFAPGDSHEAATLPDRRVREPGVRRQSRRPWCRSSAGWTTRRCSRSRPRTTSRRPPSSWAARASTRSVG